MLAIKVQVGVGVEQSLGVSSRLDRRFMATHRRQPQRNDSVCVGVCVCGKSLDRNYLIGNYSTGVKLKFNNRACNQMRD